MAVTWVLSEFPALTIGGSTFSFTINFTSNNNNYEKFGTVEVILDPMDPTFYAIDYYENAGSSTGTQVYFFNWTDEAYRTVTFETAPTGDLLTWLEANGTLTPPTPAGYEVTFVTNGGTSITKLEDVEELPAPLPTTTKSNNIFVGWFYDSGFEEQAFSGDTVSSNITLYAKWYANMSDFYQDVADAIRSKNGETNPIKHTDFAYKIKNIQGAIELTQAQYDALSVYDDNTYYLIVEE